jgi:UDPglucose--hexose-1-phosphate uridylyltransferase
MSELRKDPVSGDWVIIASGRAKRPDEMIKKRERRKAAPKNGCPFEDPVKNGNVIISAWPDVKKWRVIVMPNKYPALAHDPICSQPLERGMYVAQTGVGVHELVVTRDHSKNMADLDLATGTKVFELFQERFEDAKKDSCTRYMAAFANWGPSSGASIWHPHYQLIGLPVIPPHVVHSLAGSDAYFKKHKRCVRCDVIQDEKKQKTRIIAENSHAIAFAPFASKRPFEVSILPKQHISFFEKTSPAVLRDVTELTQVVLRDIKANLKDPDYNLFIHSAPIDGKPYAHHHWHVEIVPVNVVSPPGGFEISTIININVVDPELTAATLRGK